MDSGIMARLEVEDPLLACHDQTAGWLNRVWVESGRGEGSIQQSFLKFVVVITWRWLRRLEVVLDRG